MKSIVRSTAERLSVGKQLRLARRSVRRIRRSMRRNAKSIVRSTTKRLPMGKELLLAKRLMNEDSTLPTRRSVRESPTYRNDRLAVWDKDVSFLQEPTFVRAYQIGMDSGHKVGRLEGSNADIHIEWRVHVALWAAWHAKQLPGSFVECGVNTGIYSLAICNYIDFNSTGKDFFLFDTFEGIPEEQMAESEKKDRVGENQLMYEECYDIASRNFEPFPRARLIRGKVPDTLSNVNIDKVCYLSIDMNIAEPEIAAIEFFWDKLVRGAPILLDDYGWLSYSLQKEEMDRFASKKGVKILTVPTGQGLILKP